MLLGLVCEALGLGANPDSSVTSHGALGKLSALGNVDKDNIDGPGVGGENETRHRSSLCSAWHRVIAQ